VKRTLLFAICLGLNVFATAIRAAVPTSGVKPGLTVAEDEGDDDDDDDEAEDSGGSTVTTAAPGGLISEVSPGDSDAPIAANLTLVSDYHFRGVTQTNHQPALQGGVESRFTSGIRFGIWGSAARLPDASTSAEAAALAGFGYALARDLRAEIGVAYYEYFEGGKGSWEIPLEIDWRDFKLALSYLPRWNGDPGHAWYLSAGWSPKIMWGLTLPLAVGYSFLSPATGFENYADFRLGVAREFFGLEWALDGVFVDHEQFSGADAPWIVFSLAKYF
jgi:uncharacterized protein (TIGR02001 family)